MNISFCRNMCVCVEHSIDILFFLFVNFIWSFTLKKVKHEDFFPDCDLVPSTKSDNSYRNKGLIIHPLKLPYVFVKTDLYASLLRRRETYLYPACREKKT